MSVHELVVEYVLGELVPDQRAEFERHLDRCSRCTAEVAVMGEAMVDGAFAGAVAPPEQLRTRVLESVADAGQVATLGRRARRTTWVTAVAAAIVLIVAGSMFLARPTDVDRIVASADGVTVVASATAAYAGDGVVEVVYLPATGEAVLTAESLAPAPDGQTYQAWVIGDGPPQPAGLFAGGADRIVILLEHPLQPGEAVGVTLEPAGGSPAPTGDVLFLGA